MITPAYLTGAAHAGLEDELNELAARIRQEIQPEQRARLMNRAGDLCEEQGLRERALLYYDAAIDLYLSAGRFAASAAICGKLVRLSPEVVRARCTLAWLAVARGLDDEAARLIRDYADAALRLERPTVAQRQLRAMAEETDSRMVHENIARALLRLGDTVTAEHVLARSRLPDGGSPRVHGTPEDRERAIIARLTSAWSG